MHGIENYSHTILFCQSFIPFRQPRPSENGAPHRHKKAPTISIQKISRQGGGLKPAQIAGQGETTQKGYFLNGYNPCNQAALLL